MKIQGVISIDDQVYPRGAEVPWYKIYPFFLVHMLMFGGLGFVMAYASHPPVALVYAVGGLAIPLYTAFYLAIFGRDEVKWMFINAVLGLLGIYSQIGWMLACLGKQISDYPFHVHVIPVLYYVLYTFLLRQAVVDITNSRENPKRKQLIELCYIAISTAVYLTSYWLERTGG